MSVPDNAACTRAVREFVELGESIAEDHDQRRFWVAVAAMAADRAGLVTEDQLPRPADRLSPMGDAEAREFERQPLAFGKHQGTPIKDVPIEYLRWLSEQASFSISVRRYFESDRVQREIPD